MPQVQIKALQVKQDWPKPSEVNMEELIGFDSLNGKKYWFVYTVVGNQILIDGIWISRESAMRFGHRNIPHQYPLRTYGSNNKDRSEAVKAIRHMVLDEQQNLEAVMHRARQLGDK